MKKKAWVCRNPFQSPGNRFLFVFCFFCSSCLSRLLLLLIGVFLFRPRYSFFEKGSVSVCCMRALYDTAPGTSHFRCSCVAAAAAVAALDAPYRVRKARQRRRPRGTPTTLVMFSFHILVVGMTSFLAPHHLFASSLLIREPRKRYEGCVES